MSDKALPCFAVFMATECLNYLYQNLFHVKFDNMQHLISSSCLPHQERCPCPTPLSEPGTRGEGGSGDQADDQGGCHRLEVSCTGFTKFCTS